MDARPRDVRDGRALERLRQLAVAQLVPLRRVDDDPLGDELVAEDGEDTELDEGGDDSAVVERGRHPARRGPERGDI